MGAHKFTDDIPSLKFRDDIHTTKFFDDGGSFKFSDDYHTLKGIDDVKHGSYDTLAETLQEGHPTIFETLHEGPHTFVEPTLVEQTQTFAENAGLPQQYGVDPAYLTNQPFVLANPHHSMEWTKTFGDPNDPEVQSRQYEMYIGQLEQTKTQLIDQLKQLEEYLGKMNKEFDELKKNKKAGK
jgi:hypothetical protein